MEFAFLGSKPTVHRNPHCLRPYLPVTVTVTHYYYCHITNTAGPPLGTIDLTTPSPTFPPLDLFLVSSRLPSLSDSSFDVTSARHDIPTVASRCQARRHPHLRSVIVTYGYLRRRTDTATSPSTPISNPSLVSRPAPSRGSPLSPSGPPPVAQHWKSTCLFRQAHTTIPPTENEGIEQKKKTLLASDGRCSAAGCWKYAEWPARAQVHTSTLATPPKASLAQKACRVSGSVGA